MAKERDFTTEYPVITKYEKYFGGRKEEIKALIMHADDWLGYQEAPASHRFHGCEPGGLAKHTDMVIRVMFQLRDQALKLNIPDESVFLVGYCHDLGKCGMVGMPYYIENPGLARNERHAYVLGWKPHMGPWEEHKQVFKPGEIPDPPYVYNQDVLLGYPHELMSLYHAARFLDLNVEECQAITGHNGQYTRCSKGSAPNLSNTFQLTLLAHHADMWVAGYYEKETFGSCSPPKEAKDGQ